MKTAALTIRPEMPAVAEEDGRVIGHVLYLRLTIDGEANGASALAPVGVMPGRQKQGVGKRLLAPGARESGTVAYPAPFARLG